MIEVFLIDSRCSWWSAVTAGVPGDPQWLLVFLVICSDCWRSWWSAVTAGGLQWLLVFLVICSVPQWLLMFLVTARRLWAFAVFLNDCRSQGKPAVTADHQEHQQSLQITAVTAADHQEHQQSLQITRNTSSHCRSPGTPAVNADHQEHQQSLQITRNTSSQCRSPGTPAHSKKGSMIPKVYENSVTPSIPFFGMVVIPYCMIYTHKLNSVWITILMVTLFLHCVICFELNVPYPQDRG